jgi:hypothetical protein
MRLPWPPLRAALEARPDGGRQDDARRGQARHDARGDGEGAPLLQPVRRRASVVSPFDHLKASKSFALLRSRLDHVAGSARDPRRDAAAPRSASGTPRKSARPDRCARRPPGRIRPRGEPHRQGGAAPPLGRRRGLAHRRGAVARRPLAPHEWAEVRLVQRIGEQTQEQRTRADGAFASRTGPLARAHDRGADERVGDRERPPEGHQLC